ERPELQTLQSGLPVGLEARWRCDQPDPAPVRRRGRQLGRPGSDWKPARHRLVERQDESVRAGCLVLEATRAERGVRSASRDSIALRPADRTDLAQRPQPAAVYPVQWARPRGVELR